MTGGDGEGGWLGRLNRGLGRTSAKLGQDIQSLFRARTSSAQG